MIKKQVFSGFILFIIQMFIVSAVYAQIGIGSTREQVMDAYGEPSGMITSGNEEVFSYPGGMIVILDGKVSSLDDNFGKRLEQRKADNQFSLKQEEKGLVEHLGKWVTPDEKQKINSNKSLGRPVVIYSKGGAAVSLEEILVPGKITLVDFYADWCGPCKQLSPYLEKLAKTDRDVYLRKVNIVKWGTPVTKQFAINSIPDVRVFDRNGRMIGRPTYDFNEIISYVQRSK